MKNNAIDLVCLYLSTINKFKYLIKMKLLQGKLYEPNVNTQRAPPPYHYAALYSKQVTFFDNENLS